MRAAVILVILLAGCVTPEAPEADAGGNATAPDGADNATAPTIPSLSVGERAPVAMERFVMLENKTLGVLRQEDGEMAVVKVAETISPLGFYESFATGLVLTPWASPPFGSAWESTGDISITLRFTADAPAASMNPKPAGFPGAGAIFGTTERAAFFLTATDAPDTLEAGKEYTVTMTATPPRGGFFVAPGEQLAVHPFLSYASSDGRPASYVVGGPDPAGFVLPHQHFELGALRPVVMLDEAGETPPNPGPTGDMQQTPVDIPFTVPPEAVYVVLEIAGAPKAGQRVDMDVIAQTPSGETIAGGYSPGAHEKVVLGPGNLAAYGRDLVAHITNSASPAGGTYAVKATAYVP